MYAVFPAKKFGLESVQTEFRCLKRTSRILYRGISKKSSSIHIVNQDVHKPNTIEAAAEIFPRDVSYPLTHIQPSAPRKITPIKTEAKKVKGPKIELFKERNKTAEVPSFISHVEKLIYSPGPHMAPEPQLRYPLLVPSLDEIGPLIEPLRLRVSSNSSESSSPVNSQIHIRSDALASLLVPIHHSISKFRPINCRNISKNSMRQEAIKAKLEIFLNSLYAAHGVYIHRSNSSDSYSAVPDLSSGFNVASAITNGDFVQKGRLALSGEESDPPGMMNVDSVRELNPGLFVFYDSGFQEPSTETETPRSYNVLSSPFLRKKSNSMFDTSMRCFSDPFGFLARTDLLPAALQARIEGKDGILVAYRQTLRPGRSSTKKTNSRLIARNYGYEYLPLTTTDQLFHVGGKNIDAVKLAKDGVVERILPYDVEEGTTRGFVPRNVAALSELDSVIKMIHSSEEYYDDRMANVIGEKEFGFSVSLVQNLLNRVIEYVNKSKEHIKGMWDHQVLRVILRPAYDEQKNAFILQVFVVPTEKVLAERMNRQALQLGQAKVEYAQSVTGTVRESNRRNVASQARIMQQLSNEAERKARGKLILVNVKFHQRLDNIPLNTASFPLMSMNSDKWHVDVEMELEEDYKLVQWSFKQIMLGDRVHSKQTTSTAGE